MAYIYKITNLIDGKIYIGQTSYSVEKRWKEHLRSSKQSNLKNRPLYSAIRKYGQENFLVETIQECDNPNEQEKYWIKFYDSYKKGYNATIGGEGTPKIDSDQLIKIWLDNDKCSLRTLSKITGHDVHRISDIFKSLNISFISSGERARQKQGKKVSQFTLEDVFVQTFNSISDAERALNLPISKSHIPDVCNGKRKTCQKFKWKWAE